MAKKKTGGEAAKKKATKKQAAPKKKATRKKKAAAGERGLAPAELLAGEPSPECETLAQAVAEDGGAVLARFKDPLGGGWQLLAALPVEKVVPAPFQRDLSDTHVKKLQAVIDRLDRFLDPIVVVRTLSGDYWTPNGHHRLQAMTRLGAKAITALVVPQFDVAYQILALNTEKAPGLKERALEVIRLARELATIGPAQEADFAVQFDSASLLTLGVCYEQQARFSGSVYESLLKRCDDFLDQPLSEALEVREARAQAVFRVDALVVAAVEALKARGFQSSYLKPFVMGKLNPLKGSRGKVEFDATFATLEAKAAAFDPASVKQGEV
ncbi:MAG: ParB/RepB/Spo0J family partition protein [Planctomycetota bacterium]